MGLNFLRQIERSVPEWLDVLLIVDNCCIRKHAMVRAWLAQSPHCHVEDSPTDIRWLNQVERWFGIITQRAIRRASFLSVKELVARIKPFVAVSYKTKTLLPWTATADASRERLQGPCAPISWAAHWRRPASCSRFPGHFIGRGCWGSALTLQHSLSARVSV